jgi:outer membrane protein assembly factor BamB
LSTPSKFLPPIKHPNEIDAPPSYDNDEEISNKPIIFACSRGKVMGIDSLSSDTLWTYNCPGGRFRIPTALIEPPSAENSLEEGLIYVGAGKHLYCLKSRTGEVIWKRQLANFIFGQGFMTMATHWSSRLAAEAYTAFSQNPVAQVRDLERDSEQSGG